MPCATPSRTKVSGTVQRVSIRTVSSVRDMLGAAFNETYLFAAVNAALIALMLVLPALLVGYVRQATRRVSADFSLRRLEAFELDRAEAQYRKICQRMSEIERLAKSGTGSLWKRLAAPRSRPGSNSAPNYEDLRTNARHLRASIILFRQRPIKRLRSWVHMISSRFAFGSSLASYLTILVPATVFIYFSEQPLWAQELANTLETAILLAAVRRAPALRQRDHVGLGADPGAVALRHAAGEALQRPPAADEGAARLRGRRPGPARQGRTAPSPRS